MSAIELPGLDKVQLYKKQYIDEETAELEKYVQEEIERLKEHEKNERLRIKQKSSAFNKFYIQKYNLFLKKFQNAIDNKNEYYKHTSSTEYSPIVTMAYFNFLDEIEKYHLISYPKVQIINGKYVNKVKLIYNTKTDEVKSDEAKTVEVKSDEVKTVVVKTDDVKTDDIKTVEVKTEIKKTDLEMATIIKSYFGERLYSKDLTTGNFYLQNNTKGGDMWRKISDLDLLDVIKNKVKETDILESLKNWKSIPNIFSELRKLTLNSNIDVQSLAWNRITNTIEIFGKYNKIHYVNTYVIFSGMKKLLMKDMSFALVVAHCELLEVIEIYKLKYETFKETLPENEREHYKYNNCFEIKKFF